MRLSDSKVEAMGKGRFEIQTLMGFASWKTGVGNIWKKKEKKSGERGFRMSGIL